MQRTRSSSQKSTIFGVHTKRELSEYVFRSNVILHGAGQLADSFGAFSAGYYAMSGVVGKIFTVLFAFSAKSTGLDSFLYRYYVPFLGLYVITFRILIVRFNAIYVFRIE